MMRRQKLFYLLQYNGKIKKAFKKGRESPASFKISPDNKQICSLSNEYLKLWNIKDEDQDFRRSSFVNNNLIEIR